MQSYTYENIEPDDHLPVHLFLHSTHQVPNHWHDSIEILFVLKGKLQLFTKDKYTDLNEEDLFLINANDIHAINAEENNLVLALQIPTSYLVQVEPQIDRMSFQCNSAAYGMEEQYKFDELRTLLAEMMMLRNKRQQGYTLRIQSLLLNLAFLLQGFRVQDLSPEKHDDKHRERLLRITSYVKENYNRAINIQQLALQEYLTVPYLSRFFKEYMGTSFTKYVNAVRLDKAVKDLTFKNLSITQIAHDHGFPNLKSFNAVFKQFYRQTPGEYRKMVLNGRSVFQKSSVSHFNYFEMNPSQAFESLFKYLPERSVQVTSSLSVPFTSQKQTNKISLESEAAIEIAHTWKKLMTVGKAKEVLFAEVQKHIERVQREIGFQYVRFHGIFDDEMMIYGENERGEVNLNFAYSDSLFDFLLASGLKPFLELSFLPRQLAGEECETVFYKKSIVGKLKDLGKWNQMIHQFIAHYVRKYGIHEVRQWYFEVWNEPEIYIFWPDTYEAYCELFISTYQTIKSLDPGLRVGGPGVLSITLMQRDWLTRFVHDVSIRQAEPDFISFHSYPYDEAQRYSDDIRLDYEQYPNLLFQSIELSADTEYLSKVIAKLKETVSEASGGYAPELHMTEWNATGSHRDLVNDTCFKAAYIVKNVLENMDGLHSFGYWTATDLLEEFKMSSELFHGGLGLMTYNGIPKPAFYAFRLLSKLGRNFVDRGKGYYMTRSEKGLQVLMYAYVHIDSLYRKGDASLISRTNRYDVFEESGSKELTLELTDLRPGSYTLKRHTINRQSGSAFDLWVQMGAPLQMDTDTVDYLKQASCPQLTFEQVEIAGTYTLVTTLSPHEVQLVELIG